VSQALTLDVRLDGFTDPIGKLVRDDKGDLAFAYMPAYAAMAVALPLSLSLPLTDEPYGDVGARPFFDNLLQERDGALAAVMAREGLERSDIAGLLLHLGSDCPGALSVLPEGAPPAKVPGDLANDYEPLTDKRLDLIVQALRDREPLPGDTKDPSPLAGVQSKIALTLLPDNRFAEPKAGSGAPTTHILKVPDRHHFRDAGLEAACLDLSGRLGFSTAHATAIDRNGVNALLIARFDRALDPYGRVIRLHQEDFAQALGLPARLKYERHGTEGRRFDTEAIRRVLDATATPVESRMLFISATVFDLLTGNVDAHAKNHALLYDHGGAPRLAPRYDLLPTRLDRNLIDELPFRIGDATILDQITAADFDAFLGAMGLGTRGARSRFLKTSIGPLAEHLARHLAGLTQVGLKDFADLIAHNMRVLLPVLGLDVPNEAQGRDAALLRGGGWATS